MQFTGLRIAGFKSFVDPVDVPIEQGLTGIVGPNGCGKSNLLEALRWAMGASSAKAMRGGEMDDLIFSGAEGRPAREHAEVVLVLDNRSRTAPAEFNDSDDIEIRRTLRRGAGSSYRVNGRVVRAKDVQLLFADASTGANSPALVRQGQISELIGAKPQNRRRILEEAAGIGGLAARRHEADLKLTGAEANMEKLAEIMAEVERQAGALRRQAGKARRYRALSEEIAALEARVSAVRWRGAVNETLAARTALEDAKHAEAEAVSALARASAAELRARSKLDPLRAAETDAAGKLGALKLQLARLEAERDAARDAAARLERDLERLAEDRARESAAHDEGATRARGAAARLTELPSDVPDQRAREEADLSTAVEEAMLSLQDIETRSDARRAALALAEAQASAASDAFEREQQRCDRLFADLARSTSDLASLGDVQVLQAALETARAVHAEADNLMLVAQSAMAAGNLAVDAARAKEAGLTPPLNGAERRVRELEAELKGLERLLRQTDGPAHPPVMDLIAAPGLERALAAALGADLDAPADPESPVHWSINHGLGEIALPDEAVPLDGLVTAPDVLRARLAQCGLVERGDGARLQSQLAQGQRLVSREGDLWRWDGFVRRAEAPLPAAEKLSQRSRRLNAEDERQAAQAELDAASAARSRASQALTAAELDTIGKRRAIAESTRAAQAASEAVFRAEQNVERRRLRGASLEETIERLTEEVRRAEGALGSARSSLSAAPTEADRAALGDLAETVRAARETERASATALETLLRDRERADLARAALVRDRDEWSSRAAAASGRLGEIDRQLEMVRAGYATLVGLPATLQDRLDALARDTEAADETRRRASDAYAEAEADTRQTEFAARAARDASSSASEVRARDEARLEASIRREGEIGEIARGLFQRGLADLEAFVAGILQSAGQTVRQDAEPAQSSSDSAQLDMRLDHIRRERDGLGAVNMEADDQLAEISSRLGSQSGERDDLVAAIQKLRTGVNALNQEGRARLLTAFETVNAHFKSLFIALFGGGEAELRLTESDDPLDAGLEIYASPPGKRLGTLALMSGGEQALTATALIFAVFLSRPAPLCVLDEVDAPLDDANVDRFCTLLDEMRRRTDTRFIVITHNAVSMSRMDRLFGITMQERGVSRLVSVDLEAAERLAAA